LLADKVTNIAEVGSASLGIDFLKVTKSHLEWRDRLKRYISGEAFEDWSVQDATAYDRCELGRWLRDAGHTQFADLAAFSRLEMAHAEFHYFAGLIIIKTREGGRDEADRILRNEFSQATRRMLMELGEMNDLIHKSSVCNYLTN
jgi:hypothetical protein